MGQGKGGPPGHPGRGLAEAVGAPHEEQDSPGIGGPVCAICVIVSGAWGG